MLFIVYCLAANYYFYLGEVTQEELSSIFVIKDIGPILGSRFGMCGDRGLHENWGKA